MFFFFLFLFFNKHPLATYQFIDAKRKLEKIHFDQDESHLYRSFSNSLPLSSFILSPFLEWTTK